MPDSIGQSCLPIYSMNNTGSIRSRIALIHFLIPIVAFSGLYAGIIYTIVKRWLVQPHSYGQGFIIFLFSLYLLWCKKDTLARTQIKPSLIKGSLLLSFGCFMFFIGKVSSTTIIYETSLIFSLMGLTLLLLGGHFFRILATPLILLFFLFPIFDTLLGGHLIVLQKVSAVIASHVLAIFQIPLFRESVVLTMPHTTLNVAPECSGINHLVALAILSIPLGYFARLTWFGRILLFFLSICVGIFANGLRVAFIGLWTYYKEGASVHGPSDFLLVSFVFLFGLASLFLITVIMRKLRIFRLKSNGSNKASDSFSQPIPPKLAITTSFIALFLFSGTALGSQFFTPRPVYLKNDLKNIPKIIGEWRGEDTPKLSFHVPDISPDSKLSRIYRKPDGNALELYVAYFADQKDERDVFNTAFSTIQNTSGTTPTDPLSNETLHLSLWYVIDGNLIRRPYIAKLKTFTNLLLKRRNNAGIIIIAFPETSKMSTQDDTFDNPRLPFEPFLSTVQSYLIINVVPPY